MTRIGAICVLLAVGCSSVPGEPLVIHPDDVADVNDNTQIDAEIVFEGCIRIPRKFGRVSELCPEGGWRE